jgi:uncharacterized membrane protein HdeD (DUF308 family)
MRNSRAIYLVGIFACAYSLPMLIYSFNIKHIPSGILEVVLFVGAIGCFMKKSWAQYLIYIFTALIVTTWVANTTSFIRSKGWPYYQTTLESIIGLLPGIFLCFSSLLASWIVFSYFRAIKTQKRAEPEGVKSPPMTN